jgi:hypothetical protein
MGIKLVCLKDCVNQDTGKTIAEGDVIELSEMEASRHLAEGNCKLIETTSLIQPETRIIRRGRK